MDEIMGGRIVEPSEGDLRAVLEGQVMAMPSLHPDTGPFPGKRFGWIGGEPEGGARTAAASFYAALMGAECLFAGGGGGAGDRGGRVRGNMAFLRMLATATGRVVRGAGPGRGYGLGRGASGGADGGVRAEGAGGDA